MIHHKQPPQNVSFSLALLAALSLSAVGAEVGTFTGGDEGEGLDLQGNFLYAVNVGPSGGAGRAGDAVFTADNVTGVTVVAGNNIPGWHSAAYGDTASDDTLETVMRSIRWSDAAAPANPVVRVQLSNLEVGVEYKLQLLFAESCCARGFDVFINGVLEADDFSPQANQGGLNVTTVGAVVTQSFVSETTTLEVILDGRETSFADKNAILNGFTLERISAPGDSDGDQMADDWELVNFGDLSAKPGDDADSDGLTNLQEFQRRTGPKTADSDSDGLNDGEEAAAGTDPLLRDSDGDRLSDGDEVKKYRSNPLSRESDGDGVGDYEETLLGTSPGDATSFPRNSAVGFFTGGDLDEGLDLDGTFLYAVNIGTPAAPDPNVARDAAFTSDSETPGVQVVAGNQIPNWHAPAYGDTDADNVIEYVMQSIRWSAAGSVIPSVTLTLDVETGSTYQLQLMFAEQCCAGRAFDILLDGALVVNEYNPSIFQGGAGNRTRAAVVTHRFVARNSQVTVTLFGEGITTPEFNDHNAIFNAFTLELTDQNVDSDADGLPDPYERFAFGDLTQTATGDPDADGSNNAAEFANGTNPTNADTDGDGLKDGQEIETNPLNPDSDNDGLLDGAEINVHRSNPNDRDTDDDGLTDGEEVTTTGTDPTKADTDSDGFDDSTELYSATDPKSSGSKPDKLLVRGFTGGDDGEGLDLDGSFLYAFNVGTPGEIGQVRDAYFGADNTEGITVAARNNIPTWHAPEYGDSEADDNLERVMQSIRWDTVPVRVTLAGLTPGSDYKLQLLFAENCCGGRGFDIYVEDARVVDEFIPALVQGFPVPNRGRGAVVSYTFTAADDTLDVRLDGTTATSTRINDRNPILNGVTLEALGGGGGGPRIESIGVASTGVSITFSSEPGAGYVIEYKASLLDGPWTVVGGANGTGASVTFVDTVASRRPPARSAGFWRVVKQ